MSDDDTEPNYLAPMMRRRLEEVAAEMRDELTRADEPQLAALIEITAEALDRLANSFRDYEGKNGPLLGDDTGRGETSAHPSKPHGDKLSEAVEAASKENGPTVLDEP